MKKITLIILCFLFTLSGLSEAVEREKGVTWNQTLKYRKSLVSQGSEIPQDSNLLLDYTVRTGLVYTATLNRSFATVTGTELSDVTDFYVDWFWDFCGQQITITAYDPSVDADDVVIGLFTLESNFDMEPVTGSNIKLIDPEAVDDEVDHIVARLSAGGEWQTGDDMDVGVIHNNSDGFVKYAVTDTTSTAFPIFTKPDPDTSVNVATFCTPFATNAAGRDPYLTKFGIFLDSVPAGTKCRVYLLGIDELDPRYPILENVTLDEFNQGLGDDMIVSDYEDESTWNPMEMSNPTIVKLVEPYNLTYSFSDASGDPVFVDVPVDTSFTDLPQFFVVRADDIQAASVTSITLDTGADPRDDDYNGMRLYIGGEFRNITDYNGTTKIATIDSAYTVTPSASDPYQIKIAFLSPITIFEFKETVKGKIQDKHNTRELSFADDGIELEIGTINYVDTTGGAPTFTLPAQSLRYNGAWIDIIDKEGTFDTNSVTLEFFAFDTFEGDSGADFVCDVKDGICRIRYTDDSFGWTAEEYKRFTGVDGEVNDLTVVVTWDDVPDVNITESSVTQHEAALEITEAQISDLGDYITALIDDTTPELGGDLDMSIYSINWSSGVNISDALDEDDMVSDSATALSTQQSIKAYVDSSSGADISCKITKTSDQSISNNFTTTITWDVEEYDTDGMHTGSSGTITIKTAGKYQITGQTRWESNSNNTRFLALLKNGTERISSVRDRAIGNSEGNISFVGDFEVNDTIVLQAYQDSGVSLDFLTTNPKSYLEAHKIN